MSDHASTASRPPSPVGELPNLRSTRQFRFQWETGIRKPGPGSVSETTEGRGGDFLIPNTPGDPLTTSESSLPLGAFPTDWSSSKHGFHAISTVVNNPHKRSAPPKAHSSLPAVPPADLPRVRRKDFDSYLRTVGPEWEKYEKNAQQGRHGTAQLNGSSSSALGLEGMPTTPKTPLPLPGLPLPPLDTVPDVYFNPEFNFGDPTTFNTITGLGNLDFLDFSDPSTLAWSQPLLEQLSHHADTIEQHLIREISIRSNSFFAALANLQDLQSESEKCLERIGSLRGLLKEVDEKGAKKGLQIVHLESKLQNVEKVREGVKVVGGVVEMVGVARSLVAAGQWGEALNVIESLAALWRANDPGAEPASNQASLSEPPTTKNGSRPSTLPTLEESPPATPGLPPGKPKKPEVSVPISSLQAFASLPTHLRTLTMDITSSLTSDVVTALRLDLIDRADYDPQHPSPSQNGGIQMSLKDRLRPLLHSLVRTNGVLEAVLTWRDIAMAEARNVLKRRIPALDLEDGDPQVVDKAQSLRAMTHLSFMDMARQLYRSYLNCIESLQAQSATVVEVLEATRQPKSPVDINAIQEALADTLASVGELANVKAARVFGARAERHASLELLEFYTLFNVSWDFVVKSEVICKRMIVALRGVIVSQAKTFLQTFHQTRLSQSAKLVEDEQWNPAEVQPSIQRMVNLLVEASINDPRELLLDPPPLLSPSLPTSPPPHSPSLLNGVPPPPSSPLPSPNPNRLSLNGSQNRRSSQNPGKHLKIEDRSYFAVSATLEVLLLLVDYLKLIMNLTMLTTDTMSRVIELLKAFNSRTCQVVLGAGAMRSAGLRNITAKHLALASQSLSIMISLIPYVRETFRRHMSPKQAVILIEFDKLKRDYQEHQNEIHAKLIAIMGDRLSVHIRSLQGVRWDVPPQEEGVNEYMEVLVKETVTLHKVLSRYLPPSVVEYVMSQVFAAINHRLSEEYTKIELPSLEAKERLFADAKYLLQKLTGLKNVGAPTAMLEIVVSEKQVLRQPEPVSSPRPTSPRPPIPAPLPVPVPTAVPPPTPPPPTPTITPASAGSRFKNMLGRAATLKRASALIGSPVIVEKGLPPPSPTVSAGTYFQQQQPQSVTTPTLAETPPFPPATNDAIAPNDLAQVTTIHSHIDRGGQQRPLGAASDATVPDDGDTGSGVPAIIESDHLRTQVSKEEQRLPPLPLSEQQQQQEAVVVQTKLGPMEEGIVAAGTTDNKLQLDPEVGDEAPSLPTPSKQGGEIQALNDGHPDSSEGVARPVALNGHTAQSQGEDDSSTPDGDDT